MQAYLALQSQYNKKTHKSDTEPWTGEFNLPRKRTVDDLKQIAPLLGFSGYQPLIRAYVGQGIREDIEKIDNDKLFSLIASLKRHGVNEEIIEEALAEVAYKWLKRALIFSVTTEKIRLKTW